MIGRGTFGTLPRERICAENDHAVWIFDCFPVSPGNSLINPKRQVSFFFGVTESEWLAWQSMMDKTLNELKVQYVPDAFQHWHQRRCRRRPNGLAPTYPPSSRGRGGTCLTNIPPLDAGAKPAWRTIAFEEERARRPGD